MVISNLSLLSLALFAFLYYRVSPFERVWWVLKCKLVLKLVLQQLPPLSAALACRTEINN
jgi:hypothetical protein